MFIYIYIAIYTCMTFMFMCITCFCCRVHLHLVHSRVCVYVCIYIYTYVYTIYNVYNQTKMRYNYCNFSEAREWPPRNWWYNIRSQKENLRDDESNKILTHDHLMGGVSLFMLYINSLQTSFKLQHFGSTKWAKESKEKTSDWLGHPFVLLLN